MKRYKITVPVRGYKEFIVAAESEEEALEIYEGDDFDMDAEPIRDEMYDSPSIDELDEIEENPNV